LCYFLINRQRWERASASPSQSSASPERRLLRSRIRQSESLSRTVHFSFSLFLLLLGKLKLARTAGNCTSRFENLSRSIVSRSRSGFTADNFTVFHSIPVLRRSSRSAIAAERRGKIGSIESRESREIVANRANPSRLAAVRGKLLGKNCGSRRCSSTRTLTNRRRALASYVRLSRPSASALRVALRSASIPRGLPLLSFARIANLLANDGALPLFKDLATKRKIEKRNIYIYIYIYRHLANICREDQFAIAIGIIMKNQTFVSKSSRTNAS